MKPIKVRTTVFLHYILELRWLVMMDDGDGGCAVAAFESESGAKEYIALQDYGDHYYVYVEA
jgi:hypothetical protein